MSIAQRKDGRYVVKYKYNGKWQQRSFQTETEAKNFEAEEKAKTVVEERLSVGELITAYFRSVPHHPKTVEIVGNCYFKENGDGFFLFDRFPETLTRRDLERLRENMRVKKLNNKTINTRVSMLNAALAWGVEQDFISTNPWLQYKRLPIKKKPISVDMDAFRAIYAAAPEWFQWAMKTAFCLCLRPGNVELFDLKWSAFNFAIGNVTIAQGKSGIIKTVIPPQAYMEEAKVRYVESKRRGIDLVCPNKRGKQVTAYQYTWTCACKRAGQKMRFYDIRHLAATQMLAAGADIVSVAAQMGHQDCSMTGKIYAHVLQSGQQRAAQALTI